MQDFNLPLDFFHPLIRKWFLNKYVKPTDIQAKAWPEIDKGRHLLITAPTGSGKTHAAFLWAINQLVTGKWTCGQVRILYISPLKALNNDIRLNLLSPLDELKTFFKNEGAGDKFPDIKVQTRSGDTPQYERQRMLRHPPEIFITTPESLNILLSSKKGRLLFSGIATVILDEIHAVVSNRRGTHLITAVERIIPLSGEFQRIALSATIKPLSKVADFVAGYVLETREEVKDEPAAHGCDYKEEYSYKKRKISVIQSTDSKEYELKVCSSCSSCSSDIDCFQWDSLIREFRKIIMENRSTLLFANSRRLTEKIARLINESKALTEAANSTYSQFVYSHHGSLSREIRSLVERKLKNGELKAIVATGSLELGIDIGSLDQIILLQAPFSISQGIQRAGRGGHSVGQVSRTCIFALHAKDFLNASVLARAIIEQDIEKVRIPICPLDILAQIIVSMTALEVWDINELFIFFKTTYPYHNLERSKFDLVLEMLAGRYADTRIRELKPRVSIDRIDNTIRAVDGALLLVYLSGGTIPDRGYFNLRVQGSMSKIGELDEEFVWERSIGDVFTLGTQCWKVVGIDHQNVEVVSAAKSQTMVPFWKADTSGRDFHFSEKIALFLEAFNDRVDEPAARQELVRDFFMEERAASELIAFLKRQKRATGSDLPHRHLIVIEHFQDPLNRSIENQSAGNQVTGKQSDSKQVILHTMWGGKINLPFSMALAQAWEEKYGYQLQVFNDDDCILLNLPHDFNTGDLTSLVTPENIQSLLRKKLEKTGFFGAAFRQNAARALLLPRMGFNKRMPLWLNRLRSKKLLDSVMKYEDFPILIETWRTCLEDEFDIENLTMLLDEIQQGLINCIQVYTSSPSPFTSGLIWQQTNKYMYEDDTPLNPAASHLRRDILKDILFSTELRPKIPQKLIEQFTEKVQRTGSGYSPSTDRDLIDWVKERILIPQKEWKNLLAAMQRDHQVSITSIINSVSTRLVWVYFNETAMPLVTAIETLPRIFAVMSHICIKDIEVKSILDMQDINIKDIKAQYKNIFNNNKKKKNEQHVGNEQHMGNVQNEQDDQNERKTLSAQSIDENQDYSLTDLIGEWIRFYGPFDYGFLQKTFNMDENTVKDITEDSLNRQSIVIDHITEGDLPNLEICDAQNLEILLRLMRRQQQPVFKPLDITLLPLFIASWQGLNSSGHSPEHSPEHMKRRLDTLFGYPASAYLWESDIFPARLSMYCNSWLDILMQQSDLIWFGCGKEKIGFCFETDIELFFKKEKDDNSNSNNNNDNNNSIGSIKKENKGGAGSGIETKGKTGQIFPDTKGRYSFWDLLDFSGLSSQELTDRLWEMAWKGIITNDQFPVMRRGIENRFKVDKFPAVSHRLHDSRIIRTRKQRLRSVSGASSFMRWKSSRPIAGNWYILDNPEDLYDLLEKEEVIRERIHQLLSRYGIIFRELLDYELKELKWSKIFRSLRIMELSGEVLAGQFFTGIPGIQFISHSAYRSLQKNINKDCIYWMNASDPASLCGIKLEALKDILPYRFSTNHIVFHGKKVALISRKRGKDLEIKVSPKNKNIKEYLGFFKVLLSRQFKPFKSIKVQTINGITAATSPYLESFLSFGFVKDYKTLILRAGY